MKKIIIIVLGIVPALCFSAIYKWIDDNGKVHYSDVPHNIGEKPVELPETSTYTATPVKKVEQRQVDKKQQNIEQNEELNKEKVVGYESFRITSPADDEAVRNSPGNIEFLFAVAPALQEKHKIILYIDGKKSGSTKSMALTVNHIDRGEHLVKAVIVDENSSVVKSSESITVYLHRTIFKAPK